MSDERTGAWRPVVAVLALTACAALYVEIALDRALPRLVPTLLERAVMPESELRRVLLLTFRGVALATPTLGILGTAFAAWIVLRLLRAAPSFRHVLSRTASASWWIAAGLLAKTLLALKTGRPDPSVSLAAFVRPDGAGMRALFALTNPFVILAAARMVAGLRADGASKTSAAVAGAGPWALGTMALALLFGGQAHFDRGAQVPTDEWPVASEGEITLRYAPGVDARAQEMVHLLAAFTKRLGDRLVFKPRALRIHVYADHAMLERAAGEQLPVQVVGSVRGADLIYLELPGRSAAVTPAQGVRESMRYAGLVQLAPVTTAAPRWWVEGFVHATVYPGTAELDRAFRAALRRTGVPSYDVLFDPDFFGDPDGALMARSLVDHIAFLSGADAPEAIMRDVVAGTPFRDALFAHTRLTTTALEAGWREALAALPEAGKSSTPPTATPDSGRLDEVLPFLQGSK